MGRNLRLGEAGAGEVFHQGMKARMQEMAENTVSLRLTALTKPATQRLRDGGKILCRLIITYI